MKWWILSLGLGALASAAPKEAGKLEQQDTIATEDHLIEVINLTGGLVHPWGLAHLPDGRMLVTERPGRLRILGKAPDFELGEPLEGTPEVFAEGQGGLMDVALDPEFSENRMVYLSFAEAGEGGASTAVGRGTLEEGRIADFEVIFRQTPKVSGQNHFGNRMAFSPDGLLYVALGERFKFDPAQDLSNTLGTVVRIRPDGSIPDDNPFAGDEDADAAIFSYGHRNQESAAFDPASGELWVAEMGPLGGDELNLIRAGENYGWPKVSWGAHYDGRRIPNPEEGGEFEDAKIVWSPVISPSGMAFYRGSEFPAWQGKMLIGGLSSRALVVVSVDGDQAREYVRLPMTARIRDVEVSPEGFIDVLTDEEDGNVWRLKRYGEE